MSPAVKKEMLEALDALQVTTAKVFCQLVPPDVKKAPHILWSLLLD
jgi:hypothetical protein